MNRRRIASAVCHRYSLLLLMSLLNLAFMHVCIITTVEPEFPLDGTSPVDCLTGVLFDTAVVFAVALLLTRFRSKPAVALTFAVTAVWAFSNVVYARFFSSYLTFSAMGQGASLFDPLVMRSTFHGLQWTDLYFLAVPMVFCLVYRRTSAVSLRRAFALIVLPLVVLVLCDLTAHALYCFSRPGYRYLSYYGFRLHARHLADHNALCEPLITTFHRGSIRMLASEAVDALRGDTDLTEQQQADIRKAISESSSSLVAMPDSDSNIRNVIFIITESYMSFTSDLRVDGKEITPFLNSLRHDSTVYYNGHVQPDITLGESADGQYIYMTGLLPLRSTITVSKARRKKLPGLAGVLADHGFQSRMVIPTMPSLWNQSAMCRQYGFDHLFSAEDYAEGDLQELNDEQVFSLASSKDREQKDRRSFSVVLTVSMHQPYVTSVDPSFQLNDPRLSNELKNYLAACHYTDRCIKAYIDRLKREGLYDNSLIVITADHHVHSTSFGDGISNHLPLYIVHGGTDPKTMWQGPCHQVDVYPTLLNLLGIRNEWCGLGRSLLSPDYQDTLDDTKWDIAEWMLQSDWFSRYASLPVSTSHLIAHAGGMIDGHRYTNSREAVLQSIAKGYRYIELDLQLTTDSQLVCMHSMDDFRRMTATPDSIDIDAAYFRKQKIHGRLTPLTAADVVDIIKQYGITLVTDKISDPLILDKAFAEVRQNVMVEAFSLDDYRRLNELGYTPMLSLYHSGLRKTYIKECLKNRGVIERITTSVHADDIPNYRFLKRFFGTKITVYSSTPPEQFKDYVGREIDMIYVDDKAAFLRK